MVRWLLPIAIVLLLLRTANGESALSLADALQLAKARRSEVTQSEIDLRRARLNVLRAWLERAHLTVQASFTEQLQRLNLNGPQAVCTTTPDACAGETHPFTASASLTVPLWSGFTVEADLRGTRAHERAAAADRRATLNSVALDAALAYWEVRRAELNLAVANSAVERTREIERTARIRVDAHIAPQVDYERAHVQSTRQAERAAALEGQLAVARAQLGAALQVDDPLRLVEDPNAHAPSLPPLAHALEDAQRTRPELTAARDLVDADHQAVRAAQGAYWPQVALVGESTVGNRTFYLPNQSERFVFTALAGLQLNWVLFDTFTTWTAVRDATYVRDRAVATTERLRYQVRAEVESAHARLAAALQRKSLAGDAAAAARRALFLLEKRYQVGDTLLLEVIVAQQDLTQAEGDLYDAAVDTAEAEAQLLAAIGRL
jgi:outer membrane protein TolC